MQFLVCIQWALLKLFNFSAQQINIALLCLAFDFSLPILAQTLAHLAIKSKYFWFEAGDKDRWSVYLRGEFFPYFCNIFRCFCLASNQLIAKRLKQWLISINDVLLKAGDLLTVLIQRSLKIQMTMVHVLFLY